MEVTIPYSNQLSQCPVETSMQTPSRVKYEKDSCKLGWNEKGSMVMTEDEKRVAALIEHLYAEGYATIQERDDMLDVLKWDGVFAPLTGVTAVVANDNKPLTQELLDEIIALKDIYDEEYYEELMESQGL